MRTYNFENGTIFVHGNVDKKRLENATIQLLKRTRQYKTIQKRVESK